MGKRKMSERERRELANTRRGEVVPTSGEAVEPRQLDQMVSLRLDPNTISTLREIAHSRGGTLSDLLREGASMVILAAGQTRPIMNLTYRVVPVEPQERPTGTTANPVRFDGELSVTA